MGIECSTDDSVQQVVKELREKKFPALSDGFVRLVRAGGSDAAVVEAARLTAQTEGRDKADDETLIRYLMRHRHSTPFEFAEITLHVRVPMDAWRQWVRHRTASINEFSTRYSEAINEKDTTKPGEWRLQATNNRQGSSGGVVDTWPETYAVNTEGTVRYADEDDPSQHRHHEAGTSTITPGEYLSQREASLHQQAADVYDERRRFGVANEQARKDLPLSTYTEAYWKTNLHNLLHFLGLRMDSHAQKEIRDFADIIGNEIVAKLFPAVWQGFLDYRMNAVTLTALDVEVIQNISADPGFLPDADDFMAAQPARWAGLKRCRERDECLAKLQKLGLVSAK